MTLFVLKNTKLCDMNIGFLSSLLSIYVCIVSLVYLYDSNIISLMYFVFVFFFDDSCKEKKKEDQKKRRERFRKKYMYVFLFCGSLPSTIVVHSIDLYLCVCVCVCLIVTKTRLLSYSITSRVFDDYALFFFLFISCVL